jgi:hypothetical protein
MGGELRFGKLNISLNMQNLSLIKWICEESVFHPSITYRMSEL